MPIVQKVNLTPVTAGTSLSGTITGVTQGNSLILLAAYTQPASITPPSAPSDTNGTFVTMDAPNLATNGGGQQVGCGIFLEQVAASGSHTIALALPTGSSAQGTIVEWSPLSI